MIKDVVRGVVRGCRDGFLLCVYSLYDFSRFVFYSGVFNRSEREVRAYKTVKMYHTLEKGLSFRVRRAGSGVNVARLLVEYLKVTLKKYGCFGFHERVALKCLDEYSGLIRNEEPFEYEALSQFLRETIDDDLGGQGGVKEYSKEELQRGALSNPEEFFFSRYSVRDFSSEPISAGLIVRALGLASKTPSACNRQAWHVYHLDKRADIDAALGYQNGNRGFGHEVPALLVITADVRAFEGAAERCQHMVDGGMYAFSVVMALHSLGVGSCCLNWSQGVFNDLAFRRVVRILPNHTVIMLLAVGYPRETFKVCHSSRSPVGLKYTHVEGLDV